MSHPNTKELNQLYHDTNERDFTQLFLSDYANLYVAKVVRVSSDDCYDMAPSYYKDKKLSVEHWFIITDIRELFRNDFVKIRENFLTMITTPLRDNRTYSVYGNNYVYPLIIEQKSPHNHFESETLHYPDIYKSDRYLALKSQLAKFCFGKSMDFMHPDSIDNLISAQMEFNENSQNPLYDFSSVIVKYSKIMESELYDMFCAVFDFLSFHQKNILHVRYSVQGKDYELNDIFANKPNLGTYVFLMRNSQINTAFENFIPKNLKNDIKFQILPFIRNLQDLRNENVHGKSASLNEANRLRELILGINGASMLGICINLRKEISNL